MKNAGTTSSPKDTTGDGQCNSTWVVLTKPAKDSIIWPDNMKVKENVHFQIVLGI